MPKSCTISWKFRIYFVNKNFGGTQKSWFRHLSATALEQKGLKWYRQLYLCLHVCQKVVLSLENFGFISWTRISEVLTNLGLDTCRLQHWNKRVWNDTDNFIYASMYAKSCTISWKFRIYFVNKNFGGTQKSWFRHLSATALEQKGLKWYRQLYLCLHVCQNLYYLLKISDLFREQEFRRYSKILV